MTHVSPSRAVQDPKHDRAYVERGGDFRQRHPHWCRKALPMRHLEARKRRMNARLEAQKHAPLVTEEVVGGRLYTGPM